MLCEIEPGGLGVGFNLLLGSRDGDGSGAYSGSGTLKNQKSAWNFWVQQLRFYSFPNEVELVKAASGWTALCTKNSLPRRPRRRGAPRAERGSSWRALRVDSPAGFGPGTSCQTLLVMSWPSQGQDGFCWRCPPEVSCSWERSWRSPWLHALPGFSYILLLLPWALTKAREVGHEASLGAFLSCTQP